MQDSNWLSEWLSTMHEHASGARVLELGCGDGRDSAILSSEGFSIVALEISRRSLRQCTKISNCLPVRADIASPLPVPDSSFGVVLASLCLHYFDWATTLGIVAEIRRVLTTDGLLLMRVNSTEDVNFGAGQGKELEENYYEYEGRTKRYFDRSSVEAALATMNIRSIRHVTIDRYGKDKRVWEVCAEASG